MGTKVAKILLAIVFIAAAAVGIYFVLPAKYKTALIMTYQKTVDDNYEPLVNAVKATTIPKNKDITYDDAIMKMGNPAWTIEKHAVDENGDGEYYVIADGFNVTISMENETNDDGMMTFTDAHTRLMFLVIKNGDEITTSKKKVIEPEKPFTPERIIVDETTYYSTDKTEYFQGVLDVLASLVGDE